MAGERYHLSKRYTVGLRALSLPTPTRRRLARRLKDSESVGMNTSHWRSFGTPGRTPPNWLL